MAGRLLRLAGSVALVLLLVLLPAAPVHASMGVDDGFNLIDFLFDGLVSLFIPDEDFLEDWQQDISARFDEKLGGVTAALGYISGRFAQLREYRDIGGIFVMEFPRESFLYGIRANLLAPGREVLAWVRVCTTGMVVLATAMVCYHKVRRMISK